MSEKRFTRVEFSNGIIGVRDNNTEYEYPSPIDLLDLLNELNDENKELTTKRDQLVQKKNRYFRLYNSVEAEVKARVDTLNKVCEYYLTEAQFKADTDPNEAVKEVINRILNTEVKW